MSDREQTESGYIGPIEWFKVPGGRIYCLGHERAMAMCFAPDDEQAKDLQALVSKQAEALADKTWPEASFITPEMREVLKRAFALAREVEESELAEDLCGLLIESDPYRNPHLNTGGRDLLGEQDA